MKPARIAKFLTAAAGAGAQVLALGLLTGPAQGWLTAAISAATAIAVFLVPNQEASDA